MNGLKMCIECKWIYISGEPCEHYIKWNKSDKDKHCMISLICGIFKKEKTKKEKQNKTKKPIEKEIRFVVTTGEKWR